MLKLKLQYCGHLMGRANSLEKILILGKTEGRRRWRQQRMRWLDGITASRDMSLGKFQYMVKDREAWHAVVHGVAKNQTWFCDWTAPEEKNIFHCWWRTGEEIKWRGAPGSFRRFVFPVPVVFLGQPVGFKFRHVVKGCLHFSAWGETKGVFTVFSSLVISLNPVFVSIYSYLKGFPGSSAGKESACNAGDPGWIPELGRSSEEGIGYPLQCSWASLVAQMVENLSAMLKPWVWSLGWEDSLEEGMATHSSILAWRIPWTEELGGLQSTGSQSRTWLSTAQHTYLKLNSQSIVDYHCHYYLMLK